MNSGEMKKGWCNEAIRLSDQEAEFRKRWGLTADNPGPVLMPKMLFEDDYARRLEAKQNAPSGLQNFAAKADAAPAQAPAVSQQEPVSGPADEKYLLIDGKYRRNPKYDPPFDITLGQAIAIPPLIGAAGALLPEAAAAAAAAYRFARHGGELKIGKNLKIAPFGNRTNDPTGKWPHYHRRPSENPPPGQGWKRHRPWDKNEELDKSRWDRF